MTSLTKCSILINEVHIFIKSDKIFITSGIIQTRYGQKIAYHTDIAISGVCALQYPIPREHFCCHGFARHIHYNCYSSCCGGLITSKQEVFITTPITETTISVGRFVFYSGSHNYLYTAVGAVSRGNTLSKTPHLPWGVQSVHIFSESTIIVVSYRLSVLVVLSYQLQEVFNSAKVSAF